MPDVPHPLEEKTGGIPRASQRKLARDGKTWTPTEQRQREQALKQFCHLEGQAGNSPAYQRGWLAMFGTPEQKARALAEIEAEKTG
jgi:hypothetical protein